MSPFQVSHHGPSCSFRSRVCKCQLSRLRKCCSTGKGSSINDVTGLGERGQGICDNSTMAPIGKSGGQKMSKIAGRYLWTSLNKKKETSAVTPHLTTPSYHDASGLRYFIIQSMTPSAVILQNQDRKSEKCINPTFLYHT